MLDIFDPPLLNTHSLKSIRSLLQRPRFVCHVVDLGMEYVPGVFHQFEFDSHLPGKFRRYDEHVVIFSVLDKRILTIMSGQLPTVQ